MGAAYDCLVMDARSLGLVLIGVGVVAVIAGVLALAGALSWFGRLPGDLRFEGENTRVYIPITSMLLVSVGLSLLAALLRRLF